MLALIGSLLPWIISLLLALLCGALIVRYLTAPPPSIAISAISALAALALLGFVLARFFIGSSSGLLQTAAALFLSLAGLAGGYSLAAFAFLAQEEERSLPPLQPPAQPDGHTAVIYLTHGEPPGYSPLPWLETFREFDANKTPFIPRLFRPFFIHALRAHYLACGGSPHNFVHQAMQRGVESLLRAEGDPTTRFSLAFLDTNPRPDEAAIRAVNAGAKRIILANVFLTISSHTQSGFDQVASLKLDRYGVEVRATEPLWNSPELMRMFVERANQAAGADDKSCTGILLVGHGQPKAWDQIYPLQTRQETLFRQAVRDLLVADGYHPENIALAWMEFQQPRPAEVARELAEKGVKKLLVFSSAISAPSLHSEYDVPAAIHKAKLPPTVEVIHLGAWGYDPLVLNAICEKIRECWQA